uniref:Gibberellin regulated protein n=1 Tax=Oryza glumipatula TaxID=40148 RepID=A0A0E0AM51_9ORYZ
MAFMIHGRPSPCEIPPVTCSHTKEATGAAHSLHQCSSSAAVALNTHLTVFVRAQKDQEKMRVLPLRATTALLATLLVAASFQDLTVAADGGGGGVVPVPDSVCDAKCQKRCSLKVAGRCMGLCKMCCHDCGGCVPSGPYASKDECPCYRDMVSPKSRRPKCP